MVPRGRTPTNNYLTELCSGSKEGLCKGSKTFGSLTSGLESDNKEEEEEEEEEVQKGLATATENDVRV